MKYISTRGQMEPIGFQDAVMTGLAPDGGLLLPEFIPQVAEHLEEWATLSYTELAFEIISLFADDIPPAELAELIANSYASFDTPEVTPLVELGDLFLLELFHGPTLAFKDVALQFLGNLFEYILQQRGGHLNILGATSGDTGSAAIHGVRGKADINIFIMYPNGRTSPLQERQMTSVLDKNVFNLAVDGTFDDCQRIMKTIFADTDFKTTHSLGSINSVNWARVLAQTVYYFYSAFRAMERTNSKQVRFAVPTGNFGDILAGYLAQKMGLPIQKLILATNENDILSRFFNTGTYAQSKVCPTLSPSMDIQVASNFERYLYYALNEDADALRALMDTFHSEGTLSLKPQADGIIDPLFAAGRGNTESTLATIKKYHQKHNYILDPHTAVGVKVAEDFMDSSAPTICLATAHPAKFPAAIQQAINEEIHHPTLDALANAETRNTPISASIDEVKSFLLQKTAD
jgi:threonine synthase